MSANGVAPMYMWTVYDHPKDHPDHFVARRYAVSRDGPVPMTEIMRTNHQPTLRRAMNDLGLTCLPRDPNDDPVIVETWI